MRAAGTKDACSFANACARTLMLRVVSMARCTSSRFSLSMSFVSFSFLRAATNFFWKSFTIGARRCSAATNRAFSALFSDGVPMMSWG